MLMTVAELRRYIDTDEDDFILHSKMAAVERLIRSYTNNNFQARAFRSVAVSISQGHLLRTDGAVPFSAGDTVQVSGSVYMDGDLLTVIAVNGGTLTVAEDIFDEIDITITKVVYPADVKAGIVNMIKWELDNRDKVGVASETISRHSVTYFDMNGENAVMGFPKALLGFLRPHIKAHFGGGLR